MLNSTTIAGIVSIAVAFILFLGAFYFTTQKRTTLAITLGIAAFLFMTVIPVPSPSSAQPPTPAGDRVDR